MRFSAPTGLTGPIRYQIADHFVRSDLELQINQGQDVAIALGKAIGSNSRPLITSRDLRG
jgi:hypothetical protein